MATKGKHYKFLSKTSGQILKQFGKMVLGTPSTKIVQVIFIGLKI